ncbi:MAG TPA: hypothetical protein VJP77_06055 [Planctomycetota bacterium]|nr:hypothetical protein [Planctomycetota bacterium]
MHVSLTEAQRRFVEAKVAAGEFASVEEVLAEAVARMIERERGESTERDAERRRYRTWVAETRARIAEGEAEAARGETSDGLSAVAEIQARIESQIRERGLDASG